MLLDKTKTNYTLLVLSLEMYNMLVILELTL